VDVAADLQRLQGEIHFTPMAADLRVPAERRCLYARIPPNAVVYIDPPYRGTSAGYCHEFTREEVLLTARELASEGRMVVVSEAEPVDLDGSRHVKLSGPRGGGSTSSRVSEEWLTILGG
jgi:16S rRNA G966 N2-methylase RsmD